VTRKTKFLSLAIVAMLVAAGCSHAPKLTERDESALLSVEIRQAILEQLKARSDLRKIKGVELLGAQEETVDKKVFVYRIEFESEGAPMGDVLHAFNATATVERVSGNQWKIGAIEPVDQQMIFDTPAVIIRTRR
jgi:hypothetical protein